MHFFVKNHNNYYAILMTLQELRKPGLVRCCRLSSNAITLTMDPLTVRNFHVSVRRARFFSVTFFPLVETPPPLVVTQKFFLASTTPPQVLPIFLVLRQGDEKVWSIFRELQLPQTPLGGYTFESALGGGGGISG